MKQLLLSFVFSVLMCLSLWAQDHLTQGKITDGTSPIVGAVITVTQDNAQPVKKISDANGIFSFQPRDKDGSVTIEVVSVGKKKFKSVFSRQQLKGEIVITLSENNNFLEPLEVKAVRASDKSPFTKSEMTQADIAKVNLGKDLPYILNQTPSVVVNSDAGNGVGYTGIRVRGSDASRTNVTINGIPYNDAESQGSYFVDIPDVASSAQSIQIQRGVGTSTNGAGAFGATVNINTNQVHELPYAELSNSYSSFNSWKNTVSAGTGLLNDHFFADMRLSNISSDGYIQRAKSNLQSLLFATGYVSDKTSIRFNLITGKEKTYQAWNGVSEDNLNNPKYGRTYNELGYINDSTFYNNQTDNYVQTHYQLFWNQKVTDHLSFNLASFLSRGKGYYEEYKTGKKYSYFGLPEMIASNGDTLKSDFIRRKWLDNYFYGQTFALQYSQTNDELTLGGSWTKYDGKHYGNILWAAKGAVTNDYQYYGDLPATKTDQNIYLKWLHSLNPNWDFFADAQYRHVKHVINGYDDDPTLYVNRAFNFFNPKAGISYHKNGYNAYFSYAMANKEPGRDDFETSAAQRPKREKLHDFELGVGKKSSLYNWAVTLYYMKYKDQLVLTGEMNDVGGYTRMNVPNSYRAGIELQGGYAFAQWINANANLTFSKNKIKAYTAYYDEYDANDVWIGQVSKGYSNTDISFSPSVIGSAMLNILPVKNVELSLIGKYVGKQYLDNTQDETRKIADYYNQDIRVTWALKNAFFKDWSIIGYVYNALDKMYFTNGAAYSSWMQGDTKPTNGNYFFPYAGTHYSIGVNIKL